MKPPHIITADRFSILVKINKQAVTANGDASLREAVAKMQPVDGGSDWGGADYPEIPCPDDVVAATLKTIVNAA